MMNAKQAGERIALLRQTLEAHNRAYYVLNAPTISDFEYDLLMQELGTLEKLFPQYRRTDSPTQHVGSDLSPEPAGFTRRAHRYPMLSLANTYNKGELADFDNRVRKAVGGTPFTYVCELKFDGTAICLTYRQGRLQHALTRGDGAWGDDVTRNLAGMAAIPQTLTGSGYPQEFEIRGEILLPHAAFAQLNREREAAGEPPFANPRNAAAGSLKLLNPAETARRGLDAYLYHLLAPTPPAPTHTACMALAASWGLQTSPYSRECRNLQEVYDFLAHWDEARKDLPFATDGVVIKVNRLDLQQSLGMTAKSPRWATAYKFQAEQACTRLLSIDYQVGRTGAVTPVGNLSPVALSGTTVKRASLHNADQMALLDLHIGDHVYVEKGGEIIPKVVGVDRASRPAEAGAVVFPTHCPECGTPLVRDPEEAKHYCPNSLGCPPQIKGRILHFMGRKAMNILGGEALVDRLYSLSLVRDAADLYRLTRADLAHWDNWGEKSTDNFLESVAASRQVPFARVLFAMGIPLIGETSAKTLAGHFPHIQALMEASEEELQSIPEVGQVVAQSLRSFFDEPRNRDFVARLQAAGLQLQAAPRELHSTKLEGKKIVVSGNFSRSREDIKALLEAHGAKVVSSLSAQTHYLLAGEKMGPAKKQKAAKEGIPLLSEAELYQLLGLAQTGLSQIGPQAAPEADPQADINVGKENTAVQTTLF